MVKIVTDDGTEVAVGSEWVNGPTVRVRVTGIRVEYEYEAAGSGSLSYAPHAETFLRDFIPAPPAPRSIVDHPEEFLSEIHDLWNSGLMGDPDAFFQVIKSGR